MISTNRHYRSGKATSRRKDVPSYSPWETRAKRLADILWEKMMKLAGVLAPERPVGTAPLTPEEEWEILEGAAMELSPVYWDEPDAIRSLYQLRKEFAPEIATERLLVLARAAEKVKRVTPDVTVTPENPEFEKQAKRLGVAP